MAHVNAITTYEGLAVPGAWAKDYTGREHNVPGGAMLDPAQFAGNVPSGTVIGRTYAERDAGDGFGPADALDDEIFILLFDVEDPDVSPECELYRHGSLVAENLLPGWGGLAAGIQTALRANYQTIIAAP